MILVNYVIKNIMIKIASLYIKLCMITIRKILAYPDLILPFYPPLPPAETLPPTMDPLVVVLLC